MAYTADQQMASVAVDIKRLVRAGGIVAESGAVVIARPAPATTSPVVNNVTTGDTGLVDVGSREQSVSFVATATRKGSAMVLMSPGTYGLQLNSQNDTYWAWEYAQYQKVDQSFSMLTPGAGPIRVEVRPNGDLLTFLDDKLVNTLTSAQYLAKNPALGDAGLTKARAFGYGASMTNVSVGKYAPYYAPLSVVSAVITTAGKARIVLDYYSPADAIDVTITGPDGGLPRSRAKIVENAVAGRATIESDVLPSRVRGGAPVTITLHLASNSAFPGVQTSASWAGPMIFTINVTQPGDWYANQPLANHIAMDDGRIGRYSGVGLRGVDNADPQINHKGHLIEGKGNFAAWFVVPPRIPGQRMRYKWKGGANIVFTGNGDSSARNQIAGTDGTYSWIDFNFDWNMANFVRDGRKDAQFIWAEMTPTVSGANWPTEYDCRPINSDGTPISTGFWDKPYLDEIKAVMGHQDYDIARFMDCQRIVHISHLIIDRVTQPGDRAVPTGVSVDDILAFAEYVGCDARINLPMKATEAWVRAEARKAAKWCKRTGRRAVVEWANEIWNFGQQAWHEAVALGKAMGMTTTGHDNDIANRYHSYGQVQRMGWVREEFAAEGVANLLVRVVCVQNSNEGNQKVICENAVGAIDSWDRLETAPYIAGGAATRTPRLDASGQWDNAEYLTRARASYRAEHDHAKYHRNYALSLGKAFGTYEGGQEDAGDGGFHKQFQLSTFAATLAAEQLADRKVTVGGPYRWYADNRVDKYGLRVHGGQPRYTTGDVLGAPAWDAWLTKIAEVKAGARG